MKKILPIVFVITAVTLGIIACNNQPEEIDGEVLIKEVWNAIKNDNIDYLDNILDPAFQSIHEDGVRNKAEELQLIKDLNLGDYELSDFRITQNNDVMNIFYNVQVKETIDNEIYMLKSARLSVFCKTAEGWKWISHANMIPLKS